MFKSLRRSSDPSGTSANGSLKLVALAVAASLLASTCCVLPLVLVLIGIGGAWMTHLAALKPVTPIFTGIALLALAWAGYLVFRPRPSCSAADGQACERSLPVARRIYLACALFIGLLLSFPLFAPLFY